MRPLISLDGVIDTSNEGKVDAPKEAGPDSGTEGATCRPQAFVAQGVAVEEKQYGIDGIDRIGRIHERAIYKALGTEDHAAAASRLEKCSRAACSCSTI